MNRVPTEQTSRGDEIFDEYTASNRLLNYFGHLSFSWDVQGVHYVAINSNQLIDVDSEEAVERTISLLLQDLEASNASRTVIFMHKVRSSLDMTLMHSPSTATARSGRLSVPFSSDSDTGD